MKRPLALAALVLCVASAAMASERREISESYALEPGQRLELDFPIGSLEVEASDGERVTVELEAVCRSGGRRCEKRLEDLEIVTRSTSRGLRIKVEPSGSWKGSRLELEGVIRVPRQTPLEIDMGIGELQVAGFESDVTIDMGIGEVGVRMPESAVRSVALDAGIGESSLRGAPTRVRERRSMLIGSELEWDEGEGGADIVVDLGIGEISVSLS